MESRGDPPEEASRPDHSASARLVREALAGREGSLEELVELLTPVIQARVARVLLSYPRTAEPAAVRGRVEDLTQDVFVTLFDRQGKVLADWRPELGLSLLNFVGLVARRRTISTLRSGRRNPWKEEPTLIEELDGVANDASPEIHAVSRDTLLRLGRRLQEELTPLGWQLFELLFLKGRSVAEVRRSTGMSAAAVYAWRSRLRRLARRVARELESDAGSSARIP